MSQLLNEMRVCEQRIKGIKPVWQLYGAGCVGSQTLMGIAHLEKLRRHPWLDGQIKVWPFETGFSADTLNQITIAEIYPSQIKLTIKDGLSKDAHHVARWSG